MSYFAKVENNIVTEVISIEQDQIDSGLWGTPSLWVQTSYNTRGGVHYDPNTNEPDGGVAFRKNYAGVGYNYDGVGFYAPQPYPSWTLNPSTYLWQAPVPYPDDGNIYIWDEATLSWILKNK